MNIGSSAPKNVLGIAFLLTGLICQGQDMLKDLRHQHNARRFGIGLQALEPSGVNVQMFRGFFCSNGDTYATYGVWEVGAGIENAVMTSRNVPYKDGLWKKGGFRVDLNYLFPVFTLDYNFVFQTYVGAGLQTGSRQYATTLGDNSSFATGGNLLVRLEVGGHGFEAGQDILFVSVYLDAKFHQDFTEDFHYLKPSFGIRIRKAR